MENIFKKIKAKKRLGAYAWVDQCTWPSCFFFLKKLSVHIFKKVIIINNASYTGFKVTRKPGAKSLDPNKTFFKLLVLPRNT